MASIDISLSLSSSNTSWVEAKSNSIYISSTDDFILYGQLWTRGRYAGNGVYEIESVKLGFKKTTRSSYYSGTVMRNSMSGSASGFSSNSYSSVSGNNSSYSVAGIPDNSSGTGIVVLTYGSGNGKISTTSTKVSNTKSATITCSSNWKLMSVDTSYGTDSTTVSITGKVNITVYGTYCVVIFKKEDGSTYNTKYGQLGGDPIIIPDGPSKSTVTNRDSGNYTVSFNSNGGTSVDSKTYPWSWNNTTSYTFNYWSGSRGNYRSGNSYYLTGDDTFTPVYASSTTDKNWTYRSLGTLPTVYKKGYFKTSEWYYSNGTMASSGDEVKSSFTLYCKWEPQTYQIRYNLNGGKMPEDMGKITDYTMDKVYGVNTVRTPNFTPTRVGYTFAGWSDQNGSLVKVGVNSIISDTYYNAINTEYTNSNVTLYAQWTYKTNTLICNYYLTDSGNMLHDDIVYNIDTTTDGQKVVRKYSPSSLRSGDYVFLGWCNTIPKGWDNPSYVNNGYHGTYIIPPEQVVTAEDLPIPVELPIEIDISKFKNLDQWGITSKYYGIWSKSGKYMKINGDWKKVTKMFVKIDGAWKTITDIWTKQNNTWKHEI